MAVILCAKSPALVPEIVIDEIVRAMLALFVSVTALALIVMPAV
jgi:hypothetical protein